MAEQSQEEWRSITGEVHANGEGESDAETDRPEMREEMRRCRRILLDQANYDKIAPMACKNDMSVQMYANQVIEEWLRDHRSHKPFVGDDSRFTEINPHYSQCEQWEE